MTDGVLSKEQLYAIISDKLSSSIQLYREKIKREASEFDASLDILNKTDLNKAKYTVYIPPSSMDVPDNADETTHEGTLREAIEKAEKEFNIDEKKLPRRDLVVNIQLGDQRYAVPEQFWEKYRKA